MSKKSSNNAVSVTVAVSVSKTAAEMGQLIKESAEHDLAVIGLRNKLKVLAQQVFKAPVTVAIAAAKLGLNISVKDLDKDAISDRATVQRIRVTLERALKDGERYLKSAPRAGRPAKGDSVEGENEGEAGESVIASIKKAGNSRDAVNAILTALDGLSRAQLVRVQGKLANLLSTKEAAPKKKAKAA